MNQALTVLLPAPPARVQLLVPAIANQVVQVAVFDRQAKSTLVSSVAVSVTVEAALLVNAAPALIEMLPVGAVYSGAGVAVTTAPVDLLLALSIAQHAIAAGWDRQLTQQQRLFLYMPFQHSEDRAVQARSIELFTQLGLADNLDYAHRHKEIFDRFGRFPHRNAVLGRRSTTEELEFVATHRGF